MTNQEFSNEFDILYNSITSNLAPGLDEYEKSVFLTIALNDIIKSYFNQRENKPQQGFDLSRKRQMDFSTLMKTKTLSRIDTPVKFDNRSISFRMPEDLLLFVNETCKDSNYRYVVIPISYEEYDRLMLKPYLYPIKRGVWRLMVNNNAPVRAGGDGSPTFYIINNTDRTVKFIIERLEVNMNLGDVVGQPPLESSNIGKRPSIEKPGENDDPNKPVIIKFVLHTTATTGLYYHTFLNNPSAPYYEDLVKYTGGFDDSENFPDVGPNEMRTLSLTAEPIGMSIELIGRVNDSSLTYTVRYIRRPRPIVLVDLEEELSIQGVNKETSCELDSSIHLEILLRGVELAKAAYTGDLQSLIALGQASKTDIGPITQAK